MNRVTQFLLNFPAFCALFLIFNGPLIGAKVTFVISPDDPVANAQSAQWALGYLEDALQREGYDIEVHPRVQAEPAEALCIVVAGHSSDPARTVLGQQGIEVPETPEALALVEGKLGGRPVLLVCGSDSRGLVYALLELADRIQCGIAPAEALKVPRPIVEQPAVRIRSIYRTFTSEVEDKPWYYDREFWRQYLTELAKQRVNRFSLALGMGYNQPGHSDESYFFFAYPFLLDVPGYNVRAGNLPDEERDLNMDMLKFISDETAARGMEFQLALWTHGYDFKDNVNYPILGLTAENHALYCRDALATILKACPSITGTTLRVHRESGIPEGEQGFWETLFQAYREVDRPVWIDMHGKQLTQEQIDWALETGMPVSASPKYWGEHQGLGYHQADIRRREKLDIGKYNEPSTGVFLESRWFTRYGYGDYLPEDREWEVLHRIWPGTQVLLLSGDPALAAAYGRVSDFCDSLGVERPDPLVFKGRKGSGYPGGRCAYADQSLEPEWDFQKFLYSYRIWGRLVYNPDTDPEVWRRFLRSQFGKAAQPMETAMASASRILKLITTAHCPSADAQVYWPEIYTNQPIVEELEDYVYRDADIPRVFGNVSPLDPQLFAKINEYSAALLEGRELPKYSPLLVAQWLEDLADIAARNLLIAEALVEDTQDVEYRRFYHDIRIQSGIARFFALKMRSAIFWHLYEGSRDASALVEAILHYEMARDAWAGMAKEAEAVYVKDITFGDRPVERGHWADRLPAMDADIADMKAALASAAVDGNVPGIQKQLAQAIETVKTRPKLPFMDCQHVPAESFQPGQSLEIQLKLTGNARGVDLYYRHVNQAQEWNVVSMELSGTNARAVIPADYTDTRFPMSYYFAIDLDNAGKAIFPGIDENLANMPYFVLRQ